MTIDNPDIAIDQPTLTEAVRRALGSPTATLGEWRATPLGYRLINRVTGDLVRLAGIAHDRGARQPWSIILKAVRQAPPDDATRFNPSDDPAHWNYWRREPLIYGSGLLDDLPDGLAAPRCFATTERPDRTIWLWLEDIQGLPATDWPIERFGQAARHLGRMQGSYAERRPLPQAAWLSQGWLRANLPDPRPDAEGDDTLWQHPLIHEAFPAGSADAIARLWHDQDALLGGVERATRTFCHFDFWPPNMFARGDDQTVLIDWSMAGHGAIAEDIANLVLDSGWMLHIDESAIDKLERYALEGYIAGLREGGWDGAEHAVRFVYAAVGAMRFGLLAGWLLTLLRDRHLYTHMEDWYGRSLDEIIGRRAPVVAHGLALADQARALLQAL